MHIHFIRGDKRRCLLMRSIPNKLRSQQAAEAAGLDASSGVDEDAGPASTSTSQTSSNLSLINAMATAQQILAQANQQVLPIAPVNPASGIGLVGASSLSSIHNQVAGMGMISGNNMSEVGLLQRMLAGQMQVMPNVATATPQMSIQNILMPNIGNKSEIELASEIMTLCPGIEPWKALLIAKNLRNT